MDARHEMEEALNGHPCCFGEGDAKKYLDAYAHELAEQIRQTKSDQWDRGNQDWDSHDAADLIDPAVEK